MHNLTRPIGLLVTSLILSLIFTNTALAFECDNSGAGDAGTQDDGGVIGRLACGQNAAATGADSTAVGGTASASGLSGVALGRSAGASGTHSTAVGASATASGSSSTALGYGAFASGAAGTAVGLSASAGGDWNTTLGFASRALAPHTNATALGYRAQVEQSNAMVLGSIPGINSAANYVDVAIGTTTPQAPLHIRREDDTFEFLFLDSDLAGGPQDRPMMQLNNNGGIRFQFDNVALGTAWRFQAATGNQDNFEIAKVGTGVIELRLDGSGNLTIQGALVQNSDVNAKRDIEAVDGQTLLAKLDTLPVAEWTYKRDTSGARHLGPMAQDFHAAFGLGEDETKIAPGDMAGISLAAIKAQQQTIVDLQKAVAEKNSELADVKNRLARLESLIKGLNKPTAGL